MSKEVIIINEGNHGHIGVALNYYHAVKWLIDAQWIDDNTDVYNYRTDEWHTVKNALGADWANLMLNDKNWNLDRFNDFWDGCFYLTTEKVIGAEDEEEPKNK